MRMELLTHNKPSSPDPLHQEVTLKRPLSYTRVSRKQAKAKKIHVEFI